MAFTSEQLKKAKNAGSVEELRKLAEENGVNMSLEELEKRYKSLHTEGEISDDELSNVSGGCGSSEPQPAETNEDRICDNYEQRQGLFGVSTKKFYKGYACHCCKYYFTDLAKNLDPNSDGNGYCFYGFLD